VASSLNCVFTDTVTVAVTICRYLACISEPAANLVQHSNVKLKNNDKTINGKVSQGHL